MESAFKRLDFAVQEWNDTQEQWNSEVKKFKNTLQDVLNFNRDTLRLQFPSAWNKSAKIWTPEDKHFIMELTDPLRNILNIFENVQLYNPETIILALSTLEEAGFYRI